MKQLFLALLLCCTAFVSFAQCLNTTDVPWNGKFTSPATTNRTAMMNSMELGEYLSVNGVATGCQYKMSILMLLMKIMS